MARLVTFDDGKVGELRGDKIARLDVPTMREYFERDAPPGPTGEEFALEEVRLRAPIVPKKFFHTAGNFREHEEESKQVQWSHRIAPWIMFFQNVDAIVGPDEPVVYPEHLTEELDYDPEDHGPLRGRRLVGGRRDLDGNRFRCRRVQLRSRRPLSEAGRRDGG